MTSKLTEITQQKSAAELQTMSRESIAWLRKKMSQVKNPNNIRRDIAREKDRYRNPTTLGPNSKFLLGGLYFFYYNPKTKNELPYYDVFPLVMPLEKYSDGFLGLNFHYLPVRYRMLFMNKLIGRAIYDDNDEIKRVKITYDILCAAKRYKEFRPCLKRYLIPNIKSRILAVKPEEWDVATMLPVQAFRKAPATEVWSDSIEEIRGNQNDR
jgi:hypothetical protein